MIRLLLLALMLCFTMGQAVAQTSCPPGMEAYGAGVCGYSRADSQSAPPVQQRRSYWLPSYAALAQSSDANHYGDSINQSSKKKAEKFALKGCIEDGGIGCRIVASYSNGCVAVVKSGRLLQFGFGEVQAVASDDAKKKCSDSTGCPLLYEQCSLARYIP